MDKYKLCPGCGYHNNPLAIECEQCGEDLSSVRILDARTEEQINSQTADASRKNSGSVKMVRICEECGAKNEPQARKCSACGEDISMVLPIPDDTVTAVGYALASMDGEYSFTVPGDGTAVIIGRENEMRDYLKDKLYVSRRHAELTVMDGKLAIKSCAAAVNGTHINGTAIAPDEYVRLNAGDIVGLGGNNPDEQKEAAYFQVLET